MVLYKVMHADLGSILHALQITASLEKSLPQCMVAIHIDFLYPDTIVAFYAFRFAFCLCTRSNCWIVVTEAKTWCKSTVKHVYNNGDQEVFSSLHDQLYVSGPISFD